VLDATFVDGVGDDYLFRVTWDSDHEGLLSGLARSDVSVLSAVGTSDGWTFEVRGDDREAVAEFHTYCRTRGVPITVVALHDLVRDREEDGLTAAQRDALLYAYERGYFDSPRTATLEEVAEGLDISRQALAARLQRGHRRLIENALVTSGG
jgi:predicted DNA binding protein